MEDLKLQPNKNLEKIIESEFGFKNDVDEYLDNPG